MAVRGEEIYWGGQIGAWLGAGEHQDLGVAEGAGSPLARHLEASR